MLASGLKRSASAASKITPRQARRGVGGWKAAAVLHPCTLNLLQLFTAPTSTSHMRFNCSDLLNQK